MSHSQIKESQVPRMIDVKDLATMLHISTRTVWRLVSRGDMPQPIRFGRNVRWRVADIDAWIEKRIGLTKNMSDVLRHTTRSL